MIEQFFDGERTARRLRMGAVCPYVDGFAEWLVAHGYAPATIRRALQTAAALGLWLRRRRQEATTLDEVQLARFVATSKLAPATRRTTRPCSALFLRYLRARDLVAACATVPKRQPALLVRFADWLLAHRGVRPSTVITYAPLSSALLEHAHGNPASLTARSVRAFVLARASASPTCRRRVTSQSRMFVRFLVAEGLCSPELVTAVPTIACWRLASLPRYLSARDVERVIASCDLARADGVRDRAILVLLARLGLRAGDVASLTLDAIDWAGARFRVAGKSRREDWLPLSQEVGDAVLAYLKVRPRGAGKAVFFNAIAPTAPIRGTSVSKIVRRAMARAGVQSPWRGAHVLRHSAATAMLRAGASLHEIGAVLRHASIETTFHYAKVDHELLMGVALPWPSAPEGTPVDGRTHEANVSGLALPWPGRP
jgi:integrase/recombinase XerD